DGNFSHSTAAGPCSNVRREFDGAQQQRPAAIHSAFVSTELSRSAARSELSTQDARQGQLACSKCPGCKRRLAAFLSATFTQHAASEPQPVAAAIPASGFFFTRRQFARGQPAPAQHE